jgi:hypothetical protein
MTTKKKKPKKKRPKICTVCLENPLYNGELCDPCDASYEEWLTESKGSSLAWAAERTRAAIFDKIMGALGAGRSLK